MDDAIKKVICEAPPDLFSTLPNEVLSRIMELLPLRDAARSSILSKKWMCSWISLSQLNFDADFFAGLLNKRQNQESLFCKTLGVILLSHIGSIIKIYLHLPMFSCSTTAETGPWLSFLSRSNVKEITLNNGQKLPLILSSQLFSCLNLEKLKLVHFSFNLLPSFKGFRNLVSLELENIVFVGNSLKGLIADCPSLESLTLRNCTGCDAVYITAPNLKHITVTGKFESISFRGAPKLVTISITLEEMVKTYHEARRQELINFLADSSKIEKLCFGGYFCKFLAEGGAKRLLKANYKFLKVLEFSNIESNDLEEFGCVVSLIQSCPRLEVLKISFSSKSSADNILTPEPGFSLKNLRKVHCTSVMGLSMELKLIQFLLVCSPALEKLSIERSRDINPQLESRMTRELMAFPRESSKAEVIYMDPIKS